MRALLTHGFDPMDVTTTGWTALHHASFHGHFLTCSELIEDNKDLVNKRNYFGALPLDTAIAGGDIPTIR